MGENVIHRRVWPAPACSAQGGAFAVLPQKLGAGEQGDEGLVPKSHVGWVGGRLKLYLGFQTTFCLVGWFKYLDDCLSVKKVCGIEYGQSLCCAAILAFLAAA